VAIIVARSSVIVIIVSELLSVVIIVSSEIVPAPSTAIETGVRWGARGVVPRLLRAFIQVQFF
jgi:hypothetical protein